LFHELCHWTQHSSRLDWNPVEGGYALGELMAEIGSCYLAAELGIPMAETSENHQSYIAGWLRGLQNDHRFILLTTFKYDAEQVSLDKYTIVERDGVRHFYNWLQHYGVKELTAGLGENGFVVQEVYSDVAGEPYEPNSPVLAVVAQLV
jgi:hypothetical protein